MAVAVVLEFEGSTLEQYEQVIEKMGFTHGGPGGVGGLSHWVTPTDNGFRVTDVWRTQAAFEKFSQEQIMPFAMEAGMTSPPTVTFHEVYNYLTPGPEA
jgi:hypothetical protein